MCNWDSLPWVIRFVSEGAAWSLFLAVPVMLYLSVMRK